MPITDVMKVYRRYERVRVLKGRREARKYFNKYLDKQEEREAASIDFQQAVDLYLA